MNAQNNGKQRIRIFSIPLPANVSKIVFAPFNNFQSDIDISFCWIVNSSVNDLRVAITQRIVISNNLVHVLAKLLHVEFSRTKKFEPEIRIKQCLCFGGSKKSPILDILTKLFGWVGTIGTHIFRREQTYFSHFLRTLHLFFQFNAWNVAIAIEEDIIYVRFLPFVDLEGEHLRIDKCGVFLRRNMYRYIFIAFVHVIFSDNLYGPPLHVFGNDGLFYQSHFALQVVYFSFSNAFKFKIA